MYKSFSISRNSKHESLMEVCREAAKHFYVFCTSEKSDASMVLMHDDPAAEIYGSIREHLGSSNIYKNSTDGVIRKIIKNNYMIVHLYERYRHACNENDHSWDNAVFNGSS